MSRFIDRFHPPRELAGETVTSFDVIRAPFGMTPDSLACIKTESGKRFMLGLTGIADICCGSQVSDFHVDADEMRKAPDFFTPDDFAFRAEQDERRRQQKLRDDRERKQRELERLQRELGAA